MDESKTVGWKITRLTNPYPVVAGKPMVQLLKLALVL